MCKNHFHVLVSKFIQLSLEFLYRVYCNSLLIQLVQQIHYPRTGKPLPQGLVCFSYSVHLYPAIVFT